MSFLDRYAEAFGGRNALLLRLAGLSGGEVRGAGPWITDTEGKRWLDFGSFGIHQLGHLHPRIVRAAREQLELLGLSTKILGNEAAIACAEAILDVTPPALDRVKFANSGAEAVDMAAKLAMLSTGRDEFVAFRRSYHGKTIGALSLSDCWRERHHLGMRRPVHFLEPADHDSLSQTLSGERVAAVIIEPVQGEGGIRPVAKEHLQEIRRLCTETSTVLILDEIQTGLGRCGKIWRSAADHCQPDVLLAGKTLGGGLVPLAAVVFSSAAIAARAADPVVHSSSYSEGALACRVGREVVSIVRRPSHLEKVRALGEYVMDLLAVDVGSHPAVVEVRGEGLMVGVELASAALNGQTLIEGAKRGLLLSFCLNCPSVLRFYPPAVCRRADLARGVGILAESIRAAWRLHGDSVPDDLSLTRSQAV